MHHHVLDGSVHEPLDCTETGCALCSGVGAGVIAAAALGLAKAPVTALMRLKAPVLRQLAGYWLLRCVLAPLVLLNMSISGILQVAFQCRDPYTHSP